MTAWILSNLKDSFTKSVNINSKYLHFSQEVESALADNKPVLALESTVITHGLPYPQNLEIAHQLEQKARDNGVTPATIAVIDGVIHIGLDKQSFARLAQLSQDSQADHSVLKKIAKRDIPLALAKQHSGGTTVSATVFASYLAGISVFATGGIGGVHRQWQDSFDISADLSALASYPVIVVTAGCKAILDIPATLEQLESLSVPVYGWQTDVCPAFYTSTSAYHIDSVANADEVAMAYLAMKEFAHSTNTDKASTGLVVMNPIPKESSIPSEVIEPIIEQAISEAYQLGIKGKAITPWLLKRLYETTEGKSTQANLALLNNNVFVGSMIAKTVSQ
jgi:pseudouridine-5'-phosphate glycosidase